jgi:hypothetical protein
MFFFLFFFLLGYESHWLVHHQNKFWNFRHSTNKKFALPKLNYRSTCFPLARYIDCKSSTLGKWCYWKHLQNTLGTWWEQFQNLMGKHWEHDENNLKTWWENVGNTMRTIWKLEGKTTSKFKIPLPKPKNILILWIAMSHQLIGHGGNPFKTSSSKESKPHLAQGKKTERLKVKMHPTKHHPETKHPSCAY